ncbi:MAG: hypothetical protein OHK0015_48140 [Chloroflexi bacterium OHK40]
MTTYRMSPASRRQVIVLLLAALLIWAFAIWSFASTLRISYHPLQFWPSLQQSLAQGLGVGQVVPALLMLVLMIATPLLLWALLTEYAAAYTPGPAGLGFRSVGVHLAYPWSAVRALRPGEGDADEPFDELLLDGDPAASIANPLVRFLYRQATGPGRLPIYPGIERRDDLIAEIQRHLASPAPASA